MNRWRGMANPEGVALREVFVRPGPLSLISASSESFEHLRDNYLYPLFARPDDPPITRPIRTNA